MVLQSSLLSDLVFTLSEWFQRSETTLLCLEVWSRRAVVPWSNAGCSLFVCHVLDIVDQLGCGKFRSEICYREGTMSRQGRVNRYQDVVANGVKQATEWVADGYGSSKARGKECCERVAAGRKGRCRWGVAFVAGAARLTQCPSKVVDRASKPKEASGLFQNQW